MGKLDDKVAVITGGARGLGREFARRFAEEGADVAVLDVQEQIETVDYPLSTPDDMAETVALVEGEGRQALDLKVDVRDLGALEAAADQIRERFGRVDIICANAGILSHANAVDMTEEQWAQMIDVHLTGSWRTVKAMAPLMIEGGRGGAIVLTSSDMGLMASPQISHYVAAKHGLVGLAKSMALELAEHSIRVNTINPGSTYSGMTFSPETLRAYVGWKPEATFDDLADLYGSMNILPVKNLEPIDIANAVVYLCSDDGRYVTGISLPVDAGGLIK